MIKDCLDILRVGIEETLTEYGGEGGALLRYKKCVQLTEEAIGQVREELMNDPFFDKDEEITFYKEDGPKIWGLHIYYRRLVEIEAWRRSRSPERFKEKLQKELKVAEEFPEENGLCEYYYLGRTDSDEVYFRRGRGKLSIDEMGMFLDKDIPGGTYCLARMRAYEWLREWLIGTLERLEYQMMGLAQRRKLEIRGGPTDVVELFKALHEDGFFGDVPFARVMFWVGDTLGMKIDNFDNLLQTIQRRKKERTVFLERIKDALIRYMDNKP